VSHPAVYRPVQSRFLTIPQTPLSYWLRDRFFDLLAGPVLGDVAGVHPGLCTGDDSRFARFHWELLPASWTRSRMLRRWMPYEKGGGYGKWFGHQFWVVDWEGEGARLRSALLPGTRIQNERYYFREGWTYSYMARGSLGLRWLAPDTVFSHLASAIFFHPGQQGTPSVLNCRFSSATIRSISAKIQLNESYVSRVPLPSITPVSMVATEAACLALKQYLVAMKPMERSFCVASPTICTTLSAEHRQETNGETAVAAVLHTLEGIIERKVFAAYGIEGDDMAAVLDETGTPAGWFPLIRGYDAAPQLPDGLSVPDQALAPLAEEPRADLSDSRLLVVKRRLRTLYEAGPGGKVAAGDDEANDDGAEADEAVTPGACIPIPTETFLEELSQKIEVHPISVYWLLKELREQEGVVCLPELQRYTEDYLTVTILRLLGHRWPRQVEAGESVPNWADQDGIVPLTEGTGESTLLDRVRERIGADFGNDRIDAVEREFAQIMGRSLAQWLARDFFPHHLSHFRKRPVAWLLESGHAVEPCGEVGGTGTRQRRRGRTGGPAFACLVYYHALTADTLTRIRTHVLRPIMQRRRYERDEARRQAAQNDATARARAERLTEVVDELETFEAALDVVSERGFWSRGLEELALKEHLDGWTRRTPRAPMPDSEGFVRQEQAYDPDINDGVRVNIAPLQKYGLLAADVLATKDVEKAIADRATWRSDERRWCRDGKLPRPGWWDDDHA